MTKEDKEIIKKFCRYIAKNWINREYDRSVLNIKINKNGILEFFRVDKDCTDWDK